MSRPQDARIVGVIYISPSQIAVFKECERKWAYRYIDKIKFPPKPEQQFGILGHERNENWLGKGEHVGEDDVGLTCQQGIKKGFMPTPAPDLLIEQKLEIPILDGQAIMIGYIDCVKPPRPNGEGDDLLPIVMDWKFTKDLRWAMTAEELDEDAQAAVYGKAALLVYEEYDEVIDRWIYFCGRPNKDAPDGRPRKPRGVRKVERKYTREQIEEMWQAVLVYAQAIVETKKNHTEAATVPANQMHCDAYGGCDHREYCPLPESMGLGAALEQYNKTHQNKPLTRSANTSSDNLTEKKPMSENNLLEMLRSHGDANVAAASMPLPEAPAQTKAAPPPETTAPAAAAGGSFLEQLQANQGATGVNPPASEEAEAVAADVAGAAATDDAVARLLGKVTAPAETKAEAAPPAAPAATTTTTAPAPPAPAAPAEATPEPKTRKKRKTKTAKTGDAFVLALDSEAIKTNGTLGDVVRLNDLIKPITDWLKTDWVDRDGKKVGIPHWGLIPFGEGKAYLAMQVAKMLDAQPFSGVLVVDGSTAEGSALKEVLIERADYVFRASR